MPTWKQKDLLDVKSPDDVIAFVIVDNVIFREALPTNLLERRFSFSQYVQSRIEGICRSINLSITNIFAVTNMLVNHQYISQSSTYLQSLEFSRL